MCDVGELYIYLVKIVLHIVNQFEQLILRNLSNMHGYHKYYIHCTVNEYTGRVHKNNINYISSRV